MEMCRGRERQRSDKMNFYVVADVQMRRYLVGWKKKNKVAKASVMVGSPWCFRSLN